MCGLLYYHSNRNENSVKAVLKRYYHQKNRGSEGFGMVGFFLPDLKVTHYIREAVEKKMEDRMDELKDKKLNAIMFHHRRPTSTPNILECAHPILVDNPELEDCYFVEHNGIIMNDIGLKGEHEKLGYVYDTQVSIVTEIRHSEKAYLQSESTKFNDSESLAIELARFIEGKSEKMDARGAMAFVVLRCSKDGAVKKLYYGRGSNPLLLEADANGFCLRSEGGGRPVEMNKLFCYDYATKETTSVTCDLGGYVYSRPWEKEDPDETLELPSPTIIAKDFLDMPSTINFSIESQMHEGATIEGLIIDTYEEMYLVEDLIEKEKTTRFKYYLTQLAERKELLQERADELDIINDSVKKNTSHLERMGFHTGGIEEDLYGPMD